MKGVVYVLQCEHYFKIGYTSSSIQSRISSMATGNPFPIKPILEITFNSIDTAKAWEAALHEKYSSKRVKGEWFVLEKKNIMHIWNAYKSDENVTSKMINQPILEDNCSKSQYWKYRFLSKCDDARRNERKAAFDHRGWEASLKWQLKLNRKQETLINRLKKRNEGDIEKYVNKNKKLREQLKEIKATLRDFELYELFINISDVLANYPAKELNEIIIKNTYPEITQE